METGKKGNTGDYNTGSGNTGNCNTGDRNTGDYNTGSGNTGNRNTGDYNNGSGNTGSGNTGDYNTGDYNTGSGNTGSGNTGDRNTGDRNTGDYNTGSGNTGYFCESTPTATIFDRASEWTHGQVLGHLPYVKLKCGSMWVDSSDMTDEEKDNNPSHTTTGGYLRVVDIPLTESFPLAWAEMSQDDRDKFTSLPNFDAAKFERITGVRVGVPSKDVDGGEITINGVVYIPKPK